MMMVWQLYGNHDMSKNEVDPYDEAWLASDSQPLLYGCYPQMNVMIPLPTTTTSFNRKYQCKTKNKSFLTP